MKRRLFLKSSTVGIGGAIALPSFLYGCNLSTNAIPDTAGMDLFMDSAELFDLSVAELRLAGSGSLAQAESEDPDLAGIAEQIVAGTAIAAELDQNFAESSIEVVDAAESIYLSGPKMFAEEGYHLAEAGLAEDYAYLKVLKASTLLLNAAEATPDPGRKVYAAGEMVAEATMVHESIEIGAEAEMIESSEHLLAYSEEYVGAAESYSAENGFEQGIHSYGKAAEHYLADNHLLGGEALLQSSDDISLSSEYFAEGMRSLNAESEIFNGEEANSAIDLLPFSEYLYGEAEIYDKLAEGVPAEKGASEMLYGAELIELDVASNVTNLWEGGEILDVGANQFISGTITFNSAEDYVGLAYLLESSESLPGNPFNNSEAEAEIIHSSEMLHPASENFHFGSKALDRLNITQGVESLVPATTEMLVAAEHFESLANDSGEEKAEIGAAEMIAGAELAEAGAIESFEDNGKFLHEGSHDIETGTFTLMNGAAEFVEGYK